MENILVLADKVSHENGIARMPVVRPIASGIVRSRKEKLV